MIYIVVVESYNVDVFDITDKSYLIDVTDAKVMIYFVEDYNLDGVYMDEAEHVIKSALKKHE